MSSGRAGLHDPPLLHDRDGVAELQRLVEVVADEDDGLLQPSPAACSNSSCSLSRIKGSSAENGSSIRRISASVAKARARPTRCCMPPDSSCAYLSPHLIQADHGELGLDDPGALRLRHAAQLEAEPDVFAHRAPGQQRRTAGRPWRRCACAVRCNVSSSSSWPRRRLSNRRRETMIWPRDTLFSRLTARSKVDLPEPDRPISTQISPRRTVRLTPAAPSTEPVSARISRAWRRRRAGPAPLSRGRR
jgi:hypothetical protein